ncbi:MAG: hypothetical protein RSC93_01075 [Erysipelotrichaceae bacterium]
MLVGKFFVEDREFSLSLYNGEFSLSLKRDYKAMVKKRDNVAKLFWDVVEYEDVNEGINAFSVIIKAVDMMVDKIRKDNISYFYFYASTERKKKIYDRIAKRIVNKLGNYEYCLDDSGFYFWKK